jgi:MFS family permease
LIYGWILALPVPLLLLWADSWTWVIVANIFLGLSQGLTWSSTVVMKIDLVGESDRGLAMGINEFAGYLSVGIMAFVTAYLAQEYGLRPYPFILGIVMAVIGLLLSIFWVKDTRQHVAAEAKKHGVASSDGVFWETTLRNPTLNAITQAGFVNNLNDGMIWGLLPIYLSQKAFNFDQSQVGLIVGVYPVIWGVGQLFTGKMGDLYSKKKILFWGMLIQGVMILFLPHASSLPTLLIISGLLGLGTALVYPNFMSAVADVTHPTQRAESIGTFRLWRDLGYVFGAIFSGWITDSYGLVPAITSIGILTILSSLFLQVRMKDIKLVPISK